MSPHSSTIKERASTETLKPGQFKKALSSADSLFEGLDSLESSTGAPRAPTPTTESPTGGAGLRPRSPHRGRRLKRTQSSANVAWRGSRPPAEGNAEDGHGRGRQPIVSLSRVNAQGTAVSAHGSCTPRAPSASATPGESDERRRVCDGFLESMMTNEDTSPGPLRVVNVAVEHIEHVEHVNEDSDSDSDESLPPSSPPSPANSLTGRRVDSDGTSAATYIHRGAAGAITVPIPPQTSTEISLAQSEEHDQPLTQVFPDTSARRVFTGIAETLRAKYMGQPPADVAPGTINPSFEIIPQHKHATFWDVNDGDTLRWGGCLKLTDPWEQTYEHSAEILIQSFVEDYIRGRESQYSPEFTMHYDEKSKSNGNAGPVSNQGSTQTAAKIDKPKIYGSKQWTKERGHWTYLFIVPIPVELFANREARVFRLDALITFKSLPDGQKQQLRAPQVQVSVTHLHRVREMGSQAKLVSSMPDRNRVQPSRADRRHLKA